jgi:hypothetical protein
MEALEDRLVPSTVSGVVFNDANNNGAFESNETGIGGVTVTLTDASNHQVTTKTDATGAFSFANVAAGTYKLSESTPSGYLNGQATAGGLGGNAGNGVISNIVVGADDGSGYTFGELAKADGWSAIQSNFNGTAIKAGTTLWFSSVFKASGVGSTPVTLNVTNQTITFTANGANYNIAVPDSVITLDPTATSATTTFDGTTWHTTLPAQFSGNGFLSAVAVPVTTALPGGINPVTWQGQFTSDTPGVSVNWQWAASVYTSFSTDYTTLNVKAADDSHLTQNSDHAGTPEAFKSFVIGGARGGGGSNFTGSDSATVSVAPPVAPPVSPATAQPSSLSGFVVDQYGNGLFGYTVELRDSSGKLLATTTTNGSGYYQFPGLAAGNYSLDATSPLITAANAGTVQGMPDGKDGTNTITQIGLGAGQDGINYDFAIFIG